MRLAFLTELYHPSVGGQEVFFQELAEAMVRRGHSVDVYCIGHEPGLPSHEVLNGVRIERSPNSGGYKTPRISALRRNWFDIVRYSLSVRRVAAARKHDFYLLNQWPLMHAALLPRKARAHGAIHWCEARGGPLFTTVQAVLPRLAGMNFAISDNAAETISRQSGQPFAVLPSGIECRRYRRLPRGERSGLVYVGRLTEHKNLPLLIDAFGIATARGFGGDLIIAGEGPARAEVEAHASASPVADRIRLVGYVSEEDKVHLLSEAAVFGMPSRREGFPRVIAEAMASGTPVVTARFPGNGANAVVAQYGAGVVCGTEAEQVADGLLAAEAGWDEFSCAGITGSASLDWERIVATLESQIEKIVGG